MFLLRLHSPNISQHDKRVHESRPCEQLDSNFVTAKQCADVQSLIHDLVIPHLSLFQLLTQFGKHSFAHYLSFELAKHFMFAIAMLN